MLHGPAVRARHMKNLLASIDRLEPGESERVRALVPDPLVRDVADATSVDWLPLDTNLVVTRALHGGLGDARFYRFFRDQLVEAFSGPLLRVIVDAALRVFRVDATSFTGWVGRGWGLVFHDCGAWTVERAGPGMARLRIDALPGACVEDEIWLRSVAHSLDAFWVLARTQGECAYSGRDVARAVAFYELRWK
jgi:hypothetical protein